LRLEVYPTIFGEALKLRSIGSDQCEIVRHKFTSSLGSSAKPCKLTKAEDVSTSPDTEATGVEITFISAT
jgi:hypothetical protein